MICNEGRHCPLCTDTCESFIEVEPVRHGRVFYLDDCSNAGWYCDQCHKKHQQKPKFCSNCGAKLDLEEIKDGKGD